jgi:hypothetical protein
MLKLSHCCTKGSEVPIPCSLSSPLHLSGAVASPWASHRRGYEPGLGGQLIEAELPGSAPGTVLLGHKQPPLWPWSKQLTSGHSSSSQIVQLCLILSTVRLGDVTGQTPGSSPTLQQHSLSCALLRTQQTLEPRGGYNTTHSWGRRASTLRPLRPGSLPLTFSASPGSQGS